MFSACTCAKPLFTRAHYLGNHANQDCVNGQRPSERVSANSKLLSLFTVEVLRALTTPTLTVIGHCNVHAYISESRLRIHTLLPDKASMYIP